jgi:hypothetical protein
MARRLCMWAAVCCLGLTATGWSAEKKGVTMPDQITDQGHAMVLNGLGVRKAYGVDGLCGWPVSGESEP